MKTCSRCHETKPRSEFGTDRSRPDGLRCSCKACVSRSRIKTDFGIGSEVYDMIYKKQNGCCAICGIHSSQLAKRMAIDHNHETGEIRGLLCEKCNRGIGLLSDSEEVILKAAEYVKTSSEYGKVGIARMNPASLDLEQWVIIELSKYKAPIYPETLTRSAHLSGEIKERVMDMLKSLALRGQVKVTVGCYGADQYSML